MTIKYPKTNDISIKYPNIYSMSRIGFDTKFPFSTVLLPEKEIAANMLELKQEFEQLKLTIASYSNNDSRLRNKIVVYTTYPAFKLMNPDKLTQLRNAGQVIIRDLVVTKRIKMGQDDNYIPQKSIQNMLQYAVNNKPQCVRIYTNETISKAEVKIIRRALKIGVPVEVINISTTGIYKLKPVAQGVHPLAQRIEIPEGTKYSLDLHFKLDVLKQRYETLLYPKTAVELKKIKHLIWEPTKTDDYIPEVVSYQEEKQRGARASRLLDMVSPQNAMYARAFEIDTTSLFDDYQLQQIEESIEYYKQLVQEDPSVLPEGWYIDPITNLLEREETLEEVIVDFRNEEALEDL